MKRVKILVVLVSLCFLPFNLHSQDNVFQLTVEEVRAKMAPFKVEELKLINENGETIMFSNRTIYENMNNWFENASVQNYEVPKDTPFGIGEDGNYTYVFPKNGAKLSFEFRVDGKNYKIGVGAGTKFVVQKTETGKVSKYILLPEETVKLSPPPAEKYKAAPTSGRSKKR